MPYPAWNNGVGIHATHQPSIENVGDQAVATMNAAFDAAMAGDGDYIGYGYAHRMARARLAT